MMYYFLVVLGYIVFIAVVFGFIMVSYKYMISKLRKEKEMKK